MQATIEDNIDKRSGRVFGPKIAGRKLIIFIDDNHMPKIDTYGTQQPIALLKFLVEKGYIYERGGNLDQKIIRDTFFVTAMLPPGGGANAVDPRYLSLFSTFVLLFPNQETVEQIYAKILQKHLQNFSEDIQQIVPKLTQITVKLYNEIVEKLPRTPVKFHYIFNLRDLSRTYEGLTRSTVDKFQTKEQFIRLWRNEVTRVFSDRLISTEDRTLVLERMKDFTKEVFPDVMETVFQEPCLFGDYMLSNPAEAEHIDPKIYEDCQTFEKISEKFNRLLQDYNEFEGNQEMNLVLFNDALDHLTKIIRILRFPRGHALLVGFGGSGKQSLTRLATFTCGYGLFMITLTRGYREKEFREDLKKLYEILTAKATVFMFTDAHVLEEGFLELINNMLTIGMVPALFEEDGKKQMSDRIRDEAKRKGV